MVLKLVHFRWKEGLWGEGFPVSGHKEVVFFSDVHKHMRGLFHGVFKKVAFGAGKYIMQI